MNDVSFEERFGGNVALAVARTLEERLAALIVMYQGIASDAEHELARLEAEPLNPAIKERRLTLSLEALHWSAAAGDLAALLEASAPAPAPAPEYQRVTFTAEKLYETIGDYPDAVEIRVNGVWREITHIENRKIIGGAWTSTGEHIYITCDDDEFTYRLMDKVIVRF